MSQTRQLYKLQERYRVLLGESEPTSWDEGEMRSEEDMAEARAEDKEDGEEGRRQYCLGFKWARGMEPQDIGSSRRRPSR